MLVTMTDLIGYRWDTGPRSDNVAHYLEHLQIGAISDPVSACETAIHFFPYHFESVLEESFNDWGEEGDISFIQDHQGYGYMFLV